MTSESEGAPALPTLAELEAAFDAEEQRLNDGITEQQGIREQANVQIRHLRQALRDLQARRPRKPRTTKATN